MYIYVYMRYRRSAGDSGVLLHGTSCCFRVQFVLTHETLIIFVMWFTMYAHCVLSCAMYIYIYNTQLSVIISVSSTAEQQKKQQHRAVEEIEQSRLQQRAAKIQSSREQQQQKSRETAEQRCKKGVFSPQRGLKGHGSSPLFTVLFPFIIKKYIYKGCK